jgi:RNA polymerase sigma-70 factor (ECF subfamily)
VTVNDKKNLSAAFEDSRGHLRGVAFRMLGSLSEAEDAVQEAWIRSARAETAAVENLRGWLTTVTARVCLDMLRSRKARAEHAAGERLPDIAPADATSAEQEAVLADSVGLAMLVVLETLDPAERLAFVLHDLFDLPFEEIAPIVGRSPAAARQLASRARRRVRGAPERDEAELARRRDLVTSLLAALRAGDVEGVVAALDPNVVVHAQAPDGTAREIRGARNWAKSAVAFTQLATKTFGAVAVALVDGDIGAIYAPRGSVARALKFTFERGVIARVDIYSDPATVRALAIAAI